jgi:GNAT superfamily N-acetyltransferase
MISVKRADLTEPISLSLINALNAELRAIYSQPGATHFGLDPADVAEGRGAFLIVYQEGNPVGCGAVRLIDPETAELKRMYIIPAARGNGLGRRLLADLEAEARAVGARRLVLETGVWQAAALALYRGTGFDSIPLYGEYCLSPETSVCLGKELVIDNP